MRFTLKTYVRVEQGLPTVISHFQLTTGFLLVFCLLLIELIFIIIYNNLRFLTELCRKPYFKPTNIIRHRYIITMKHP